MIAHWENFLGVIILTIFLFSNYNLGTKVPKALCSDGRLYFKETQKCYHSWTKGPCGKEMVVKRSDDDERIGVCKCDIPHEGNFYCPMRPKVFIEKYSRCFSYFDQGPCKEGEWLVPCKDKNGTPKCQAIPCPERYQEQFLNASGYREQSNSHYFVFPYQGKCYTTTVSLGPKDNLCKRGEILFFVGTEEKFNHICHPYQACAPTAPRRNDCPDGSKPDIHNGCESNTEFEDAK